MTNNHVTLVMINIDKRKITRNDTNTRKTGNKKDIEHRSSAGYE